MHFGVIRNKKQALDLTEMINKMRLTFKFALQDIYPYRSLDANSYYWGVIMKIISDETGQPIEECHEGYKIKYNFRWDFVYDPLSGTYEFTAGVDSTATLDNKEFWDYIFRVRCDAEIELRIIIPYPNECFVNDLDFARDRDESRNKYRNGNKRTRTNI